MIKNAICLQNEGLEFSGSMVSLMVDNTVIVNTATVSGENLEGEPDDESNNQATASTTGHSPVLELTKTASATVNAGEAILYTITYTNTGSADAYTVVISDTLPQGVYYSTALDKGSGPKPGSVSYNADGTTTLQWTIGTILANSASQTIAYTARPGLLFLGGDQVANDAVLTFTDENGCVFPDVTAAAATGITEAAITMTPESLGYYKTHPEAWTSEILARIQATDTRYDGADGSIPNGILSATEVRAVFASGQTTAVPTLRMQLLATYFNLALREINAGTAIESKLSISLNLLNVRDAAIYAETRWIWIGV